MTTWMRDPRDRRIRGFGPGPGLGSRPGKFRPRRGGLLEFLSQHRRIVIVVVVVAFFAVVALGATAGSPD